MLISCHLYVCIYIYIYIETYGYLTSIICDTYVAAWSVPVDEGIQVSTGSVDLVLSTGVTQQVFDRVSTALECIHYMETNKLYYLSPNEYITIMNLRSKLLIIEHAYINQKMMNSYGFTYHDSEVRAIHRSMSELLPIVVFVVLVCLGMLIRTLKWKVTG